MLNRLHFFLAPPAFRCFYRPYSSQKYPYCFVSYFGLVEMWAVFFRGVSKYWVDFKFCPRDVKTTAAGFSFLHLHFVPLSKLSRSCMSQVLLDVCHWIPCSACFPPLSVLFLAAKSAFSFLIRLGWPGIIEEIHEFDVAMNHIFRMQQLQSLSYFLNPSLHKFSSVNKFWYSSWTASAQLQRSYNLIRMSALAAHCHLSCLML